MTARETNWAGNIVYRAARVARPRSISEVQELVAANAQVRAVGTGHSFNRIADTPGVLISLADLPAGHRHRPRRGCGHRAGRDQLPGTRPNS